MYICPRGHEAVFFEYCIADNLSIIWCTCLICGWSMSRDQVIIQEDKTIILKDPLEVLARQGERPRRHPSHGKVNL